MEQGLGLLGKEVAVTQVKEASREEMCGEQMFLIMQIKTPSDKNDLGAGPYQCRYFTNVDFTIDANSTGFRLPLCLQFL